jgi:ankyrin repeat protein
VQTRVEDMSFRRRVDGPAATSASASACVLLPSLASLGVDTNADADMADVVGELGPLSWINQMLAACRDGHKVLVEWLLRSSYANVNARGDFGETPLHNACWGGDLECVRLLLDRGADVHASDRYGATSLHFACRQGHAECARLLLGRGARSTTVDRLGNTPLHVACARGNVGCVFVLLERGSYVVMETRNEDGHTPLSTACCIGDADAVRLLLAAGASVSTRVANDAGATPLFTACWHGQIYCAALLLKAGADATEPNQDDSRRRTPLHVACFRGSVDFTRLLLEWGADVNVTDRDGETPAEVALARMNWECLSLVQRAARLREERGVPVGGPLPLDWTESTHRLLLYEHRRLLHRALGALLLVDARRDGGATLGREGALAFVAGLARLMGV